MVLFAKSQTQAKADPDVVDRLYRTVTALARAPVFYLRFAVPDTNDGRYDLLCLMLSLMLFRVQQLDPAAAQALFDLTFKDVERGLREAGVGDLGVPKHMKRMLQAFYGRAAAYYEALEQQQAEGLAVILTRNLYNMDNIPQAAHDMAEWVRIVSQFLAQMEGEILMQDPDTLLQLLPPEE